MNNKAKIAEFNVWDEDTGEADVIAEFEGNINIKAFSLDSFEQGEEYDDIILSMFCKEFEVYDTFLTPEIKNINDKYNATIQGKIINHSSNDEEGDFLTVDAGNIYVDVYIHNETKIESGKYFKGTGRLDIEIPVIP